MKQLCAALLAVIAALVTWPGSGHFAVETTSSLSAHGLHSQVAVDRLTYLVGDVEFPSADGDLDGDTDYDDIGEFGDGILTNVDLIYALRAITSVPGYRPEPCSDRYDAIDSFPVDTETVRGGDGILNTVDLIYTLRRVTLVLTSRPRRLTRCLVPCPGAIAGPQAPPQSSGVAAGQLEFAAPSTDADGTVRVPVYLQASRDLALAGLAYGLGLQGASAPLSFVKVPERVPTLIDTGVRGALAAAWLEPVTVKQQQRILLGQVTLSGLSQAQRASSSLVVYGVVADAADGSAVRLDYRSVVQLGGSGGI